MPKKDQESYQKIRDKLTETVESYKTRFKKDTKGLDYKPKILSSLETAEMDIDLRKEEDAREEFKKIEDELNRPYNNEIQGQEQYFREWKNLLQKEHEKNLEKRNIFKARHGHTKYLTDTDSFYSFLLYMFIELFGGHMP